ncbi:MULTISPECIES: hypothetical protein [Pseudomonas syringae group genomosp. 2]|uniref:hypothetical protein n=1 Tax=Pseudomonas syringae group genomosp. 2 TaxID=251698 RepID=UPI00035E6402|nr:MULTISPECIES: hypothetical protein [Pseudomonas syringae group genomosp. 2]KEZ27464.1 hypothetical protein A3SK_0109275 [Pseudomonas amygdali pv. tabaci str. 6605]QED82893.1 hypothetical protein PSYTB_03815 [Pseudomonas amygdali pv. tabaci str. ATCC 11528]QOI03156.1 hypothetical protein D5S10_04205 [Pseudomonas savastanoi]BCS46646.1 hypothetical protein Pta6605_49770 [Pseudomonas amygdali pv. tabaci]
MNPAFEQALQARLLWLQVRSYGSLGFHQMARDAAHKAYWLVEELAMTQARCEIPFATYAYPYGAKCPIILSDVPRLADLYEQAWSHEAGVIEEEREEAAEQLRREQSKAYAIKCIERNDWKALDLPSPEHLSEELYAGRPMRVDGHFLDYEDGIVWMDNPYGVEGCLGEEPTIQLCRQFLTRIAKGGMYGPEP